MVFKLKKKKGMSGAKRGMGMDLSSVRWGFQWSIRWDLERVMETRLITADWSCRDARRCAVEERMYVGNVLDLIFGKFHFWVKRAKTEISANSESTRLCLGCFNPCVCHWDKVDPLETKSYEKLQLLNRVKSRTLPLTLKDSVA